MVLRPDEDEYQRLISAMNANEHQRGEFAEQDFLNIFCHGRIVRLDSRFNRQVCALAAEGCLSDRVLGPGMTFDESPAKQSAIILHFVGDNKPWNMQNCIHQNIVQLCIFWKYFNQN